MKKLHQLGRQESAAIVEQRKANTCWLQEAALYSNNPIIRDAAALDSLAKSMGCFIEYEDNLDPDEDNY